MIGSFSYLFFFLFFTIFWIFLFIRNRETRREMLIIGILAALFTPLFLSLPSGIFSALNERSVTLHIADFLFSFLFAGIAAVLFQSMFGKFYKTPVKKPIKKDAQSWLIALLLFMTAWAWVSVLLSILLDLNSIQAIVVSAILVGMYIIMERHDLLWNAIWSAIFMSILFFIVYQISFFNTGLELSSAWWFNSSFSDRFIASVPVEALLWSASLGFVLGPLYEYVKELRLTGPGGSR